MADAKLKETEEYDMMVCTDCRTWLIGCPETSEQWNEQNAIAHVEHVSKCGGQLLMGDSEKDDEFSPRPCDCCGTYLAGSRHHALEFYIG